MGPEGIFMLLIGMLVFTCAMWSREHQHRRRLENRLWGMAAARGIELPELDEEMPRARHMPEPRIEQLENQVDMIAQQLERLNDSQEFLSRIMTQRLDSPAEKRIDTPH